MRRRTLQVIIVDDFSRTERKWHLNASESAGRWYVRRNGTLVGVALWSRSRLRWEATPGFQQPSDTMLRVFHLLIGEAFPVGREVAP